MTLREVVRQLDAIAAIREWRICSQCDEEITVDVSDVNVALAQLRLDIERYILKTEGTL